MKKRVLSALVLGLIFVPTFIKGGNLFKIVFFLVSLECLKEYMSVREQRKEFPNFIKLIAYVCLTLFYFGVDINDNLIVNFDYRIMTSLLIVLFIPIILYNNKNKYNINDASQILGSVLLIGSFSVLINLYRTMSLNLAIFVFLLTIITDVYALFSGMLVGKHQLCSISPNKTWEGFIFGSFISTFVSTVYFVTVLNTHISLPVIIPVIILLTIVGQLGDLFFSAIKRYYKVKDFANIIPGHGGLLDRFDSVIFVSIAYSLIMTLV